ncbi:MAG: 1-acyl-sn-glycerol-3-phosphate acyltransferase [Hyphomicrobiaceae bacterium]|nr:MAG: 1-acyl-sn-glycerol-3-phosphate acyltransferase [Hyphomicrobiaceae bacterium]
MIKVFPGMSVLTIVSPALKVIFDRIGKPEIIHRPPVLQLGGRGAVIACNHVGWADSLWMAYAVYPRHLRYMSKEELFGSPLARWILHHGGSIPIDRTNPSLSSIKSAVDILQNGEIILIFPAGTRKAANAAAFKRGAATVALHARVPLVPAFYEGPTNMQMGHMMHRPRIRVTFGAPIPTTELPLGRATTFALTRQLEAAISNLKPTVSSDHALMELPYDGQPYRLDA